MKRRSIQCALLLACALVPTALTAGAAVAGPDTHTWSGAGAPSAEWSAAANWQEGVVPEGGDSLVFPAGVSAKSPHNDLTGLSLKLVTIADGGYAVTGDAVTLEDGMTRSGGSGSSEWGTEILIPPPDYREWALRVDDDLAITGTLVLPNTPVITKTGAGTLTLAGSTVWEIDYSTPIMNVDGGTVVWLDPSVLFYLGAGAGTSVEGSGYAVQLGVWGTGGTLTPGTLGGAWSCSSSHLTLSAGGNLAIRIDSARGSPGVSPGWAQARTGRCSVEASSTVRLLSVGSVADFDPRRYYRWPVVTHSKGDGDYDVARVSLDTSAFTPDSPPIGAFSLRAGEGSLDIEYMPPHQSHHWTGAGGDDLWSTAANWHENLVPENGDDLVFPAGVSAKLSDNDLPWGFHAKEVTIADGGYMFHGSLLVAHALTRTGGAGSSTWRIELWPAEAPGTVIRVDEGLELNVDEMLWWGGEFTKTGAGTLTLSGKPFWLEGEWGFITVAAGDFIVSESFVAPDGSVTVAAGGTLGGRIVQTPVYVSGNLRPGTASSVGELTTGRQSWMPGGSFTTRVASFRGSPGSSWDHLSMTSLATLSTAADPFVVKLVSAGGVADFDPTQCYQWQIASASLPSGFDTAVLSLDVSGFTPEKAPTGTFSLIGGEGLSVAYAPPFFKAAPVIAGGADSVAVGTRQTVTWETSQPVGTGSFDVVAVDRTGTPTTVAAGVRADGSGSYSAAWNVLQNAGSGWTLHVTHSDGEASPASDRVRIVTPALAVSAPAAGSSWSRGTTETVGWTCSPALDVGSFRVWATPAAGGTTRAVSTTVVPVVPGRAAYSLDCRMALPSGAWKLSVYYYAGTVFTCQNPVKPVVTVP